MVTGPPEEMQVIMLVVKSNRSEVMIGWPVDQ